jgi:hypothetical protein
MGIKETEADSQNKSQRYLSYAVRWSIDTTSSKPLQLATASFDREDAVIRKS